MMQKSGYSFAPRCFGALLSFLLLPGLSATSKGASSNDDYAVVYEDYPTAPNSAAATAAEQILTTAEAGNGDGGLELLLPFSAARYRPRPTSGGSRQSAALAAAAAAAGKNGYWIDPFAGLHASGRYGKRETQYLSDLSRRLRDMFIEYKKRQNAFQFGLGKRGGGGGGVSAFSFGLGKRSSAPVVPAAADVVEGGDYPETAVGTDGGADVVYAAGYGDEPAPAGVAGADEYDDEPAAGSGTGGAAASKRGGNRQAFSFGLGKRASYASAYPSGNSAFAFGLGKRPSKQQFSFGLGKRGGAEQFAFGLGKRAGQQYSAFQFGLGKRPSSSRQDQRFAFGLGKRSYLSLEDDVIDDSVPVGEYLQVLAPRRQQHQNHHHRGAQPQMTQMTQQAASSSAHPAAAYLLLSDAPAAYDGKRQAAAAAAAPNNYFQQQPELLEDSHLRPAFRFGLGKRSVDDREQKRAADDGDKDKTGSGAVDNNNDNNKKADNQRKDVAQTASSASGSKTNAGPAILQF